VYWNALDDDGGRAAIVDAIDAVAPLDFAVIVEAAGNSAQGALASWSATSKALVQLANVNMTSGHETLAIFFDSAVWTCTYTSYGDFDPGRPWLLASFMRHSVPDADVLWILAVHLPHFLDTESVPGAIMADALRNATAASGQPQPTRLVVTGDFNEFEWEDNPCSPPHYPPDCREQAAAKMAPLWDDYLHGTAHDLAAAHTITCCTKWSAADRDTTAYKEWRFEYDHVFVVGDAASPTAALLPYIYPGTAAPCADAACTGEDPPENVTTLSQGSWHRGWVADLSL